MTRDLYASFQRLKNFPLDVSSMYATMEDLQKYLSSSGVAYAGQIVGVYNDGDENDGVYIIVSDNGKLVPKKSASQNDLDKLSDQIKNEVQVKLDKISKVLGDTEGSDETGLIQKVDKLRHDLNFIIDNNDGTSKISEALDSIKEISDWINRNQANITKIEEFRFSINQKFNDLDSEIDQLHKRDAQLQNKDSDLEANNNDLKNEDTKIKKDISDINKTIDILPHSYYGVAQANESSSMSVPLFNKIFKSDQIIKSLDIYNYKAIEPTETATIEVSLRNITTGRSFALVTNSTLAQEKYQNFLDSNETDAFHYEINYRLPVDSGNQSDDYQVTVLLSSGCSIDATLLVV